MATSNIIQKNPVRVRYVKPFSIKAIKADNHFSWLILLKLQESGW